MKNRTFIRAGVLIALVAVVALFGLTDVFSTNTTKQAVVASHSPFGSWLQYQYTWVLSEDTVVFNLDQTAASRGAGNVTAARTLLVRTQSAQVGTTSDSVSICIRYQISPNGTDWQSITVGTDSTTWATRTKSPNYQVVAVSLPIATFFGHVPYARLLI